MKYSCQVIPQENEYKLIGGKTVYPDVVDEVGYYYWNIVNFDESDLTHVQIRTTVEDVFKEWNRCFNEIEPFGEWIKLKETNNFAKAHIKIFFCGKNHNGTKFGKYTLRCPFPFDGRGGVVAHAWKIGTRRLGGHIHIDTDEVYGTWINPQNANQKKINFFETLLHESGHCLGLDHSTVKMAIMGAFYSGDKYSYTNDDKHGLSAVYGQIKARVVSEAIKSRHSLKMRDLKMSIYKERKNIATKIIILVVGLLSALFAILWLLKNAY